MSCKVCNYGEKIIGSFLGTPIVGEEKFPDIHPFFSKRRKMALLGCPFVCPSCCRFVFNMRAKWDYVLLWPIPLPEKYMEGGEIVRPQNAIDVKDEIYGRSDYGIVLSFGPGYYTEKGKFKSTGNQLYVGAKVLYDKNVPWRTYAPGYDGKKELVIVCGYRDIKCLVYEKEGIE